MGSKGLANPYNAWETIGLLWRNLVRPSRRNPCRIRFMPQDSRLNLIEPRYSLGFAGDILMMFNRPLHFDASVQAFFAGCTHIIGNMEGVITDLPKEGPDQKHTPDIMDTLARLAPPERFYLSMANNHTGDFGEVACRQSAARFKEFGFHVFGLDQSPWIDLNEQIRIVTGTQWTNRKANYLARLEEPTRHLRDGAMNILFPHWGYEMECYPRATQVAQMNQWLASFDAVVGHHSHLPQPVTALDTAHGRRLAAYSLGDFCFGVAYKHVPVLKHFPYGLMLKASVGPRLDAPHQWAIGDVQWRFIDCDYRRHDKAFELKAVPRIPYFKARAIAS